MHARVQEHFRLVIDFLATPLSMYKISTFSFVVILGHRTNKQVDNHSDRAKWDQKGNQMSFYSS